MNWRKRISRDALDPGESVVAAMQCRARGWMVTAAVGQTVGALAGAAVGGAAEGGLSVLEAHAARTNANSIPRGDVLFVVTDRRCGIFMIEQNLGRGRPVPSFWFPPGAIVSVRVGRRITARSLELTFSDGSTRTLMMLRGQGDPHAVVEGFAHLPVRAAPSPASST